MTGKRVHSGAGQASVDPTPPADSPINDQAADALQANVVGRLNAVFFLFVSQTGDDSKKIKVAAEPLARTPTSMPLQLKFSLEKNGRLTPFQLESLSPEQRSAVTNRLRKEVAQALTAAHINPNYVRLYFEKQ